MTITAQIHYQNGQYWRGIVMIVILANFMLFLTDGLTSNGFPNWWIYPSAISAMILLALYAWRVGEYTPLTTAFYEYCLLNGLLFFTWLIHPKMFPWFIVPIFLLAIPLVIMYMRVYYAEYRSWLYICVTLVIINVMIFLVWGFAPNSKFPWFLVVWAASVAIMLGLYSKYRNEGNYTMEVAKGTSEGPFNFSTVDISPQSQNVV